MDSSFQEQYDKLSPDDFPQTLDIGINPQYDHTTDKFTDGRVFHVLTESASHGAGALIAVYKLVGVSRVHIHREVVS